MGSFGPPLVEARVGTGHTNIQIGPLSMSKFSLQNSSNGRAFVCPSVPSFTCRCCGFAAVRPAGRRYRLIAALPAVSGSGAAARRSAANASSITLTKEAEHVVQHDYVVNVTNNA